MNKDLTTEEVGFIYGQMKSLEVQHPKAKIKYDLERNEVLITYQLPADFHYHNNTMANKFGMKY
jgi:hypothetical protein